MDWSLLETFLAAAKAGSFTAAADALQTSQPTVSRRISALEEGLGVTLFVRHARGLVLTDRGAELLKSVQDVGSRIEALERRATGMREVPAGDVRVSVNEPLGLHVLTPALASLMDALPQVELELVVDNSASDLSRREADIAVRMFEPTQPDLIARRIGVSPLGLFASPAYVQRRGLPQSFADAPKHVLIGADRDASWHRTIRQLGLTPQFFRLRTDSLAAQFEAIRAGVGIGGSHKQLARRMGFVPVLPEIELEPLPIWLVTHAELRTSAAVRAVFDAVAAILTDYVSESEGASECPADVAPPLPSA